MSKLTDKEHIKKLELEILKLRAALMDSNVALDTWTHTYAAELCNEASVEAAYERIKANGGTLAYIAHTIQTNRQLLKQYENKSGYNCLPDNQ